MSGALKLIYQLSLPLEIALVRCDAEVRSGSWPCENAGALRDVPQLSVLDAQGSEALVEIIDGTPEKALEIIQGTAQVAEFARVVRPLAQIYREAVR